MSIAYKLLNILLVYSLIQSILHVAFYKRILRFPSETGVGFVWTNCLRRSYMVSKVVTVIGVPLCLCVLYWTSGNTHMSIPRVTGALAILNYAGLLLGNFTSPKLG